MKDQMYYFGTVGHGHYFYNQRMVQVGPYNQNWPKDMPWTHFDGALLPCGTKEPQSSYVIHHAAGWTAMAFWDRTGDKRGGSNSVFIARGILDAKSVIEIAKVNFPKIMKRLVGHEFVEWKYSE